MNEATVGLTFTFGDATYSVARRVRRTTKGGATTPDASLERNGEVIASSAGAVTDAVERLLGLDFRQFTTCVLLPQGEFARFLNERPARRQELLGALLDLGLYDIIGALASGRSKEADGKLSILAARLSELGRVTDTDLEGLRTREKELDSLAAGLNKSLVRLDAVRAKERGQREVVDSLIRSQELLAELCPPEGWEQIALVSAAFDERRVLAEAEHDAAALEYGRLAQLEVEPRSEIVRQLKRRSDQLATSRLIDRLSEQVGLQQRQVQALVTDLASAERELEDEINADRAAHLRSGLEVGDTCPVCGGKVTALPTRRSKNRLDLLQRRLDAAQRHKDAAVEALQGVSTDLATAGSRLADLESELLGVGSTEALEAELIALDAHHAALAEAKQRLTKARAAAESIARESDAVGRRLELLRSSLGEVWPKLSSLQPPLLDLGDPLDAWRTVLGWRDQRLPDLSRQVEAARKELEDVGRACAKTEDAVKSDLAAAGLQPRVDEARELVQVALAEIATAITRVEEAREETERVTDERDAVTETRDVSRKLSAELAANKFKKWIFDEVFASLVAGANLRLADLTSGQYELAVTSNDFEVIDHFAADKRRGIRSLSGGETFLVSLALAVALADEVAAAAGSHIALDSFFLDEGFGTLDGESLEVVARVIADLGAAGKTVGIVTHVEELAEQMPVRYEVRRTGNAAAVTQVGQ
jgi:exonuclease SbcC